MLNEKYPEHEKLKAVSKKSQLCGEFLEWLQTKYYMIDKTESHDDMYIPLGYSSYINFQNILADFFDIDLELIEKEKEKMLDELRSKGS